VAVPFLGAPQYREFAANVPGDSGFDPLNLWSGEMGSFAGVPLDMRDAEIKHGRLAMLAAAHWLSAETFHPQIAEALGVKSSLTAGGLNPSLLNGGLDDPRFQGFLMVSVVAAAITDLSKDPKSGPGDYGMDFLGLKGFRPPVVSGFLAEDREWMGESEVVHGRLAMVAITAFAAQEFVTKVPVLNETPGLF